MTLTVSGGSPSFRMMLHHTGMMKFLAWNNYSLSWEVFFERPGPNCDPYASCGPFGYCDDTQTVATCKCLDGFETDGLNFSLGCQRKKEVHCGRGDSFITLRNMKLPDKFLYVRNRSFDQCAAECSRNCSCTAYAYADLSSLGMTVDQSRCLVWMGELVDMKKRGDGLGENLYLRIPSSSGICSFPTLLLILCDGLPINTGLHMRLIKFVPLSLLRWLLQIKHVAVRAMFH